ncbi:MAG: PH domain-containing protein [Candidatus Pacebacteria bacterium]|nr:PH domain-containing protein [Candidatus Paceibacterota bacterium]
MIELAPQEHIIALFRKHWFVILLELLGLGILALAPIALYIFGNIFIFGALGFGLTVILGFFYVLFLIVLWIVGFNLWLDFYLDKLVVTNERVIEIEQRGLFSREISSLNLENIQDVTIEVHGIIQTFFKLGDIHVQTSGAQKKVSISYLAHPEYAKHMIMDLHNQTLNRVKSVRIEQ